ncbi:MAG TPA: helicase C-terminal domain-containing protein [Pyrinomonadaceae bacterium]|jgi:Rad3-related DNA helicases|nr:helicase C-terminal domain-containing protein [Pyrinomonadaceae bacterium]
MLEIFGPEGLIAQAHPEYEHRPGQIDMARAVLRAFEEQRHLIVEAGTGTGKTLAYLVPAVASALAGRGRVIVSTGTKNLQEQLMEKDIPFLQGILPKPFSATYMKGRSNYLCLNRLARAEGSPILEGLEEVDYFEEVCDWARQTQIGDRAELANLPEGLSFWRHIDARPETCLGQKCPDFDPCFITRMRDRAKEADIVVVNHHLFFADLALRNGNYGSVLPDYTAVILDEAHLIEDVASEYFGSQVSNYQVDDLVRDIGMLKLEDAGVDREVTKSAARMSRFADNFWMGFREGRGDEGRYPIVPGTFAKRNVNGAFEATPLGDLYSALDGAITRLETTLDAIQDKTPDSEGIVRRLRQIRFDLQFIVTGADKKFVYWVERRNRGIFLRASPIDVAGLLQDKLFDAVPTVVLTSATLSSGGNFAFIRDRLGLDTADDLIAESVFDYESQAILYLPSKMPDPRSREWSDAAADEVIRILNATQGRAFVLSTSVAGMQSLFENVWAEIEYPCLVQGSASKGQLLNRFRETPNAVLFATSSFWQGVDVRGEQLSCVIIDKLPFAVPTDPIVAARQRYIEDSGGSSFHEYSVPQAIIALKQGLGRLIRSTTDRGVLAVLDPRLRTKPYGRTFLRSLPQCRVTSHIEDLSEIFQPQRLAADQAKS